MVHRLKEMQLNVAIQYEEYTYFGSEMTGGSNQ
jgi:hypothetical protein